MRISPLFILLIIITLSVTNCSSPTNSTAAPPLTVSPNTTPDISPTATPSLDTIEGSFRNQIGYLEENMPRADSEGYVVPKEKEQDDFAELVSMLAAHDLGRAAELATQNNYTLIYYVDRGDDKAMNYLLRENKPIQKGWGLYAFRVDSTSNIIIEAPHPRYDRRTPTVAMDIYRALDARALLIAGAHRNANSDGSADMAHTTESIFHSIHVALSKEIQTASGDAIILQIHGFHTSKHDGYPQAVFGFGEKMEGKEITIA
ncbi:MAG: hypothetical protein L0287_19495, partial [Anaerolineae bacterium]|nr:hypothetical protein [Anaerolineae bacterium]